MAQKITIMEDSLTMSALFNRIEQQTSYTVAYNHSNIDTDRKILLPQSFRNTSLKDALSFALKETSCMYIIRGSHIVIIPASKKGSIRYSEPFSPEKEEVFVFKGIIADRQTKDLLGYATVYLLDSDNRPLAGGASDGNGLFHIVTNKIPSGIKISFIGYETLLEGINNAKEDLGLFQLETIDYPVEETVVTASRSKVDMKVYNITSQMREGTTSVYDLLDKINDLYYDKSSTAIRAGNKTSLLLVNGMQQSFDYISSLSPSRIRMVEVVYESSGRFISDNFETMINLVLEEYTGRDYDVFASNLTTINTEGINDNNWLAEERPVAGISYINDRINLYTTYSFNRNKWDMPLSKEVDYDGIKASYINSSRDLYQSRNHNHTAGISYTIKPNSTVSFQSDYSSGNMYSEYAYMGRGSIPSNINNVVRNATENLVSDKIFISTLSFQGKINNRLRIHGDFSYNYYYNDMESRFGYPPSGVKNYYSEDDLFNEYKNHTRLNVDAQYFNSSGIIIDAGYSNSWRQYASESSHGKGFLDYNEYRNTAFAYLSFKYKDRIKTKSGIAVEDIMIRNRAFKTNLIRILPYIHISYNVNEKSAIDISYAAKPYYPVLFQLSPMSITVDTLLKQVGNQHLMPSTRHTATLRYSFADRLTLTSSFSYTADGISETYIKSDYKLYRTFENINTKEYDIHVAYNRPVSKYLNLKAGMTFYYAKAMHSEIENDINGWLFNAESSYYIPNIHLGIRLGYYRNMKENILWQGYRSIDKDNWLISLNKVFPHQAITVSLSYIPPLLWGVRPEQHKEINTSIYSEKSSLNLKTFNNMLFLNISFRINGTKHRDIKPAIDKERQGRTMN